MKTNFKVTSKMHLFIIITSMIIAIGLAVGLACYFTGNGYFNYGAEWSNNKTITVNYEYVDFTQRDDVTEICNGAFESAGVSSVAAPQYGESSTGGVIIYTFSNGTSDADLEKACAEITAKIVDKADGEVSLSSSAAHSADTLLGGGYALTMCAIALSVAVAVQFVYFVIRYKISMALSVLLADVHTLALYLSVLSLARIPVGASMFAFGLLAILVTMLASGLLFGKMRANLKNEDYAKYSKFELVDETVKQSQKISWISVCVAAVAVVLFALTAISSLSVVNVIAPAACALAAAIISAYSSMYFVPSVYARFAIIGEKIKISSRPSKKKAEQSN